MNAWHYTKEYFMQRILKVQRLLGAERVTATDTNTEAVGRERGRERDREGGRKRENGREMRALAKQSKTCVSDCFSFTHNVRCLKIQLMVYLVSTKSSVF